jgi:hypothetical protein
MHWGLIIAAIIAAALGYGYWDHTQQSRHLTGLFAPLAARYRGELKRATLLTLPQLRFELEGRHLLVAAMATSGHVAAGTSGYSGPFTFVDLSLPFDTGQKVRVERNDSNLTRSVDRVIDGIAPGRHPATGHEEFDASFRIQCSDPSFAVRLLDPRVRQELLSSPLPRLDVRLEGQKIIVHSDGIARSEADLEGLIELAVLLADRCPPSL